MWNINALGHEITVYRLPSFADIVLSKEKIYKIVKLNFLAFVVGYVK